MGVNKLWSQSVIKRCSNLLTKSDRSKVAAILVIQISLSFLDLLGVAVVGILGALSISGIESGKPGNRVSAALRVLHISHEKLQTQVSILGILAATLLISRTVVSIFFTRRTLYFFGRRSAILSSQLMSNILLQPLSQIKQRTTQQSLFAITAGTTSIMMGILATSVNIVADAALLTVMTVGLLVVDPSMAISTFAIFGIIGLGLYKLLHKRSERLGQLDSKLNILSNEKITEVLNSYRESVVRNRRSYYAQEIEKVRMQLASVQAESGFMPNISKYVIETATIFGAVVISAIQFITQDATHAVATLSVFLAAGTRIAPALLRIQQGAMQIKNSKGNASPTLDLIDSLSDSRIEHGEVTPLDVEHDGFNSSIEISNLSVRYPEKVEPAVEGINLSVAPGALVAVVGPSGAGKTSLIDALLGVIIPNSGYVRISHTDPLNAFSKWPGAVSYVPQDVLIINGTIRENVALGYPLIEASDRLVTKAIKLAQLEDLVSSLPLGLETQVGDRGTNLSGGQRQRLGIARALFTQPKLLVLDEATSALDAETEKAISDALLELKGETTVVLIAHRLSTVQHADEIFYLENGKLTARGKFEDLRKLNAQFDLQAKLMGL